MKIRSDYIWEVLKTHVISPVFHLDLFTIIMDETKKRNLTMKFKQIILSTLIFCAGAVKADTTNLDSLNLANDYAQAWFKTQMSTATKADLEHYLSFLTEDVAYQHLPYDKTDEREEGGKDVLRKSMTQWLASNVDYKVTINSINFSNNLITINYNSSTTIIDSKTKEKRVMNRHVIDSLELDGDKVSIIRKYW